MIRELCNEIFFGLRSRLPVLRHSYSENLEREVSQSLIPSAIAQKLSERSLRQSLFYAEILEDLPEDLVGQSARILDLGSKDFICVAGMASFLAKRVQSFELTGLELDPFQIYYDLYKRGDCARYYVDAVRDHFGARAKVQYIQGDWLRWTPPLGSGERYDLITSFFPFLFEDLHDRFGLPKRGFSPKEFYSKIFEKAKKGLFFHQGATEKEESLRLIEELGGGKIEFQKTYAESSWINRKHPVEVILWGQGN